MALNFLALTLIVVFGAPCFSQVSPPKAPIRPVTDDYFGTKVVDNYRYFENLKDPEVEQWIRAQADYTRATLDALPGRAALIERITAWMGSTPTVVTGLDIVAGRYYTLRTPAGAQSPKLYVRDGVRGEDRLLIDPEKLSPDQHSHLTIDGYTPSPDGRYVAYGLAAGGSQQSTLHILDVQARKDLPETADRADNPVWRADGRSFFYRRAQKMTAGTPAGQEWNNPRDYIHVLGRAFDDDPPIVGRGVSDAAFSLTPTERPYVMTAPSSRYAIAFVSAGTDDRLRVYAAPIASVRDGHTAWRPIAASYDDQYIAGDNSDFPIIALAGDTLYWMSRKDAPRGRILKLDLTRRDSRPEVVVEQGDLPISGVYAARGAIYWWVSDAGINGVRRLRLRPGARAESLHLPYVANVVGVSADAESDATVLSATSSLRPPAYLGVDAKTGAVTDTGLQPAGPSDQADDLVDEEVRVKSWDGTLVPLSIIHTKTVKLDGTNPTLLSGYGAYGLNAPETNGQEMRVLSDRNGITATCHVRGGGEYGEAWHQAGRQATKPNTWKDFIACAEYLIAHRYTSASHLVGSARSAGGILIGRAIEERPDLFAAAIEVSPVTDMLRFETTANGPGNTLEFGTVKTEAGFKALYAMSPYANVKDGVKYPAVLIMTGMNDPRVAPWLPAKLAARFQAATASGKPVLLRVDYDAGHGLMDATRSQAIAGRADVLSFVLWQTGDPAFQPNPGARDSVYESKMHAPGVRMIPVDGGKYKVWSQRVGDGKIKLLLLHGGPGGSPEYFENFPEHLGPGYEIYFYSQLGSYLSDQPTDTTLQTVARKVEEVEEVRKALGLEQFYLLGHSWGSLLATAYAAKYQQHLKGLILSNASIFALGRSLEYQHLLIADIADSLPSVRPYADSIRFGLMNPHSSGETFAAVMAKVMPVYQQRHYIRLRPMPDPVKRAKDHAAGAAMRWLNQDMNATNYTSAMAALTVPTLFIGSTHDYMPPYDYQRMKNLMTKDRDVSIAICPNGAHFDMWDDATNYFAALTQFIGRLQGD